MTEEHIGHCVKIALAFANMTAPQLAAKLGVTNQTAYSYVKGKNDSIGKLTEIAEACGMSYDEMINLVDQ